MIFSFPGKMLKSNVLKSQTNDENENNQLKDDLPLDLLTHTYNGDEKSECGEDTRTESTRIDGDNSPYDELIVYVEENKSPTITTTADKDLLDKCNNLTELRSDKSSNKQNTLEVEPLSKTETSGLQEEMFNN